MQIMQGDAYHVRIAVTIDGEPLDFSLVEKAELTLGNIKKEYPDAVSYDEISGKLLFPISQQESFALPIEPTPLYLRLKLKSGEVIGKKLSTLSIAASASKEVL